MTVLCLALGWLSNRNSEMQRYAALARFGIAKLNTEGLSHLEESTEVGLYRPMPPSFSERVKFYLYPKVEYVYLFPGRVTSADLSQLNIHKLSGLQGISFAGTGVTDNIVAMVTRHTELEEISLENTMVSDASIESLMDVKTLKKVNLANTAVTDKRIQLLQEALPECLIIR